MWLFLGIGAGFLFCMFISFIDYNTCEICGTYKHRCKHARKENKDRRIIV